MTPNDPKLSDRGARRGTCVVGERRRPEAGAVTCGAVRCSAWLGVISLRDRLSAKAPKRLRCELSRQASGAEKLAV